MALITPFCAGALDATSLRCCSDMPPLSRLKPDPRHYHRCLAEPLAPAARPTIDKAHPGHPARRLKPLARRTSSSGCCKARRLQAALSSSAHDKADVGGSRECTTLVPLCVRFGRSSSDRLSLRWRLPPDWPYWQRPDSARPPLSPRRRRSAPRGGTQAKLPRTLTREATFAPSRRALRRLPRPLRQTFSRLSSRNARIDTTARASVPPRSPR
jgi:hypothetical protein